MDLRKTCLGERDIIDHLLDLTLIKIFLHPLSREVRFWEGLIDKYLKPLEKDAEKEKQIGNALKELRNQMVFSFLMINSIWVLTIFLLQENKDLVNLTFCYSLKL